MYLEEDLLPLSALQHLAFCERQFALIHIEQVWEENRLTAEGRIMHERVHDTEQEARGDTRVARGLRLRSLRHGLAGVADVVEFQKATGPCGAVLPGVAGRWQPYPVEYKRGRPKPTKIDKVQLCAQALCLEEMLGVQVPQGALFYGQPRRRQVVEISETLRKETAGLAARAHELFDAGVTPEAVSDKRCENCSLERLCLPELSDGENHLTEYLRNV